MLVLFTKITLKVIARAVISFVLRLADIKYYTKSKSSVYYTGYSKNYRLPPIFKNKVGKLCYIFVFTKTNLERHLVRKKCILFIFIHENKKLQRHHNKKKNIDTWTNKQHNTRQHKTDQISS